MKFKVSDNYDKVAIYVAYGGPLAGRIKVSDLNCERSDVTEVGDSFILSGTISKSGGTDENWYCAVVSYIVPAGGVLHGRTRWIPVDGKPFGLQRSGVSRTGSTLRPNTLPEAGPAAGTEFIGLGLIRDKTESCCISQNVTSARAHRRNQGTFSAVAQLSRCIRQPRVSGRAEVRT